MNGGYKSHNSPASVGASVGPGKVAGAGEMPAKGPGPAARGRRSPNETDSSAPASSATPRGMSIYREE